MVFASLKYALQLSPLSLHSTKGTDSQYLFFSPDLKFLHCPYASCAFCLTQNYLSIYYSSVCLSYAVYQEIPLLLLFPFSHWENTMQLWVHPSSWGLVFWWHSNLWNPSEVMKFLLVQHLVPFFWRREVVNHPSVHTKDVWDTHEMVFKYTRHNQWNAWKDIRWLEYFRKQIWKLEDRLNALRSLFGIKHTRK